jgi:ubiquinone/menaquinone biosynthesis C-methylase UbiE
MTSKKTKEKKPIRLDIGCGEWKHEGFIGVDRFPYKGVDKIIDLERESLPYENESVDEIYASHFIEHTLNPNKVILDMIRVLKVGGRLTIKVPFYTCVSAYDPGHKSFYSPYSFAYYTRGASNGTQFVPDFMSYTKKPYMRFNYFKDWKDLLLKPFEFFANHVTKLYVFGFAFIIPAFEIEYDMKKIRKYDWKQKFNY